MIKIDFNNKISLDYFDEIFGKNLKQETVLLLIVINKILEYLKIEIYHAKYSY